MSDTPRHRGDVRSRHRVAKAVVISLTVVVVAVLTAGYIAYRQLDGNIRELDVTSALGTSRPTEIIKKNVPDRPLNILVLGSDTRDGQAARIGGETPGLSDTAILVHLSGDRQNAYAVSIQGT